jgi:hypothetical protein
MAHSQSPTAAELPLHETFETATTTWQQNSADAQYRIAAHRRVLGEGRAGTNCEWLSITAGHGSYLYIAHPIRRCRIVSELLLSVGVKANRPGLQLLARVVLPHSLDAATGKPLVALVEGTAYKQAGGWEELRIDNFPQLVERQVRVLRARHGSQVDPRGAYIDVAVLNVYGGQGATQVWIDDLELQGAVEADTAVTLASVAMESDAAGGQAGGGPMVRLSGNILNIDGRPVLPRIIEHQGEGLAFLRQMGFNGVRLNVPPSAELLSEAEQAGMWIVGPPPAQLQASSNQANVPPGSMPAAYDRVLAWSLGQGLTARDFDRVAEIAQRIRLADRQRSRPLLYAPETELLQYSRELRDLLSAYRFPLATSLELNDYANWLRTRPQLARPGTAVWTVIQTQPAASLREQWSVLSGGTATGAIDADALRLLAFTAVAAGVRGIEFASHSRLDAADNATRLRGLTLSIINDELELIEPWAAAGSYVSTVDSNDPLVKAVSLQYESSRLLLATRIGRHAQFLPQHGEGDRVSFVVPGIPESHDIMELTSGGLRPLKHKRVTGGTLIALEDFDTMGLVLATPDPVVSNAISRRLAALVSRAAERRRELAARTAAVVESVERRLPADVRDEASTAALWSVARGYLAEADKALTGGDRRAAYIAARRANAPLGQLQRQHWEHAFAASRPPTAAAASAEAGNDRQPASTALSPFLGSFGTLPEHWRLMAALRSTNEQGNRLQGGDFEDLPAMLTAGWRHFSHSLDGVVTVIEVVPGGTSKGRSCLRMEVRPAAGATPAALLETAPVWVTTPPVPLTAGTLVRIRGRVRVAAPIRGSVDGLMIIESLGGEALAERIGVTSGWQQFELYRAAPRDADLTVTIALTGFGEAMVDDLEIVPLQLGQAVGSP